MAKVIPTRMTAEIDGDFVVFLIGMRINKAWKIHKWLPVFMAMAPMLKELEQHPESGFLGHIVGRKVIVQYWRSFEHLEAYARTQDKLHWPAWVAFNKKIGGSRDDVGIWHETYQVRAGEYRDDLQWHAALRSRQRGQARSGQRQSRIGEGTHRWKLDRNGGLKGASACRRTLSKSDPD